MFRQCVIRSSRPYCLHTSLNRAKPFSTSSVRFGNRAVIYTENGDPAKVLRIKSYEPLPPPPSDSLNIRFRLSPINPSDINVIQGVYPAQPTQIRLSGEQAFVGGNEGLAEVIDIGRDVKDLQKGDWVISAKPQIGTWSSSRVVHAEDVIRLPAGGLSEVNAATIAVNPPTAYNMLNDFVDLKEGDWVLQNGANSAVGQAVIQIAAKKGIKTINFIRNRPPSIHASALSTDHPYRRPSLDDLITSLTQLGATHVFTYDALNDRSLTKQIKQWTSNSPIRLILNCVGGPDTTAMTRFLGEDAYLVSYGAMSKKPLSLPTSAFIFKNLQARGFWQSRWYKNHTRKEREDLMQTLADLKLKEPEHEILDLSSESSDEFATEKLRRTLVKMEEGFGKKVLLRL